MKRLLQLLLLPIAVLLPASMVAQSVPSSAVADGTLRIPRTFQDETQLPSPDAARMLRHADQQVSHATGAADIGIPLCSMQVADYTLDVSLGYRTSGVKADDEGCVCGLGWALQCGGSITRTIHGRPDELRPFDLRTASSVLSSLSTGYLTELLHRRRDANYDRYHYSLPGYSGGFIIDGSNIVQIPQTDLLIELCDDENEGVRNFLITTPEGTRYHFAEREHTNYSYHPVAIPTVAGYLSANYEAVTAWHLSDIVLPTRSDTLRFGYSRYRHERSEHPDRLKSRTLTVTNGHSDVETDTLAQLTSLARIVWPDKCVLRSVSCRTCSLSVSSSKPTGSPYARITSMRLFSSAGTAVRDVSLSYGTFADGRLRLDQADIRSGGVLLDRRTFGYYSGGSQREKDFFGYNNQGAAASRHDDSVLNTDGSVSLTRSYDFSSARGCALHTLTDATGAETTLEYEANTVSFSEGLFPTVGIGLRLKEINVSDPVTGRWRKRSFTYANPACTIDMSRLTASDFIEPGGLTAWPDLTTHIYTTGATFTASCRVPGVQAEDAAIYYGLVTEDVSGTGIDGTLRTEYEYDVTDVVNPYIGGGGQSLPDISDEMQSHERYLGTETHITHTTDPALLAAYRLIFAPHWQRGHFRETCWEKAPLIRRTSFRHTGGTYVPAEEDRHFYSTDKEPVMNIGFYVTAITRNERSNTSVQVLEVLQNVSDFNFYETTLQHGRLFCDSTRHTVWHHDGTCRTTVNAYTYNGHGNGIHPHGIDGFVADSLRTSPLRLPLSVRMSCGPSSLERYWCYTSNVRTGFYRQLSDSGRRSLPLMEKTVADGTATMLLSNAYAPFDTNANVQLSSRRLTCDGNMVAVQDFTRYDEWGNLLGTVLNQGPASSYVWGYAHSLPVAAIRGSDSSDATGLDSQGDTPELLGTQYTHEPLIGCTSIVRPDGHTTRYEYSGGRLSLERNNGNTATASYSYALKTAAGVNKTSKTVYTGTAGCTLKETVYYDGLGLPVTTVKDGSAPDGSDVASITVYDGADRPTEQWLPAPMPHVEAPIARSAFSSTATSFYSDTQPWQQTTYDAATNGMARTATLGGSDYAQHPTLTQTIGSDPAVALKQVRRLSPDGDYAVADGGLYGQGELTGIVETDGDGRTTVTFTDWRGRKTLERCVEGESSFSDTYYIYDALGDLRFVLPPALSSLLAAGGGSGNLGSDDMDKYAYIYRYDEQRRLVEKKLPGAEPIYYLCDLTGNAVLSQDGNLREQGKWRFSIPDIFGRTVVEGICETPASGTIEDYWVTAGAPDYEGYAQTLGQTGYTVNVSLPGAEVLTARYYDGYGFLELPAFSPLSSVQVPSRSVTGLPTGTLSAVLPLGGSAQFLCTATLYDTVDRPADVWESDIRGGTHREQTTYSLDGRPLTRTVTHRLPLTTTSAVITESYTNGYDNAARLATVTHRLNNGPTVTLTANTYDALGRVTQDTRNGCDSITTAYGYDLHGWLTDISSPLFAENLYYHDNLIDTGNASYTGTITGMEWKANETTLRSYNLEYDPLRRLSKATYYEGVDMPGKYDTEYGYDAMGNITSMRRCGFLHFGSYGLMDDLTLEYDGNHLVKVSDTGNGISLFNANQFIDGADLEEENEYLYDANGNMTSDANRGISRISYNELNLPDSIVYNKRNHIFNKYSSGGKLLRSETSWFRTPIHFAAGTEAGNSGEKAIAGDETMTSPTAIIPPPLPRNFTTSATYCGNVVFGGDTIRYILFDGGYITSPTSNPKYHFYLRDHLGSNRVVASATGAVKQVTHYYPYGLPMYESTGASKQPYKYNGKEQFSYQNINWLNYGARWHDPILGRWHSMDSRCEEYPNITPYSYCHSDPFNRIDPNGNDDYYSKNGVFIERDDKETDHIIIRKGQISLNFGNMGAFCFNIDEPIEEMRLSAKAYSAIYTDILYRSGFDTKMLTNGCVSIIKLLRNYKDNDGTNYIGEEFFNHDNSIPLFNADIANSKTINNSYQITAYIHPKEDNINFLNTISNVISVLGVHEFIGHRVNDLRNEKHWLILDMQRKHSSWENISPELKELYYHFEKNKIDNYDRP